VAHRLDTVTERIRTLLAAPQEGSGAPARDPLEATLTEGYAAALELDGERMRLERRIEELTAKLAEGGVNRPQELRKLIGRLDTAEEDLAELRDLLAELRSRATRAA
jgi:predicted  nucleic acid-binding Zn-ribbon protein